MESGKLQSILNAIIQILKVIFTPCSNIEHCKSSCCAGCGCECEKDLEHEEHCHINEDKQNDYDSIKED
jgi:hypothetical protein